MGRGSVTTDSWNLDRLAELKSLVLPLATACATTPMDESRQRAFAIQIETTGTEIVDISVKAATRAASKCMEDSVWALALREHFDRDAHFEFAILSP